MKYGGFVALSILVAAACTGSDPGASPIGGGGNGSGDGGLLPDGGKADPDDPNAGAGPLVLGDIALSASPAGKVTARLTLARNGVVGAIRITVPDVPAGIVVEPLEIAADASEGDLVVDQAVKVDPTRTRVTLQAEVGDLKATRPVAFVVRGLPGTLDTTTSANGVFATPLASSIGVAITGDDQNLFLVDNACKISRHLATGAADDTFVAPAITATAGPFAGKLTPSCSAITMRGATVAVGGYGFPSGPFAINASLFRMDRDGKVDPASVYIQAGANSNGVGAVAIDADGTARMIVQSLASDGRVHQLHRVDAAGKLLNTPVTMPLATLGMWTFLPDGSARMLGSVGSGSGSTIGGTLTAAGFTSDGALDTRFGSMGFVTKPATLGGSFIGNDGRNVYASTVDATGRTVAVGLYIGAGMRQMFLARHSVVDGTWNDAIDSTVRPAGASGGGYGRIAVDARTGAMIVAGSDATGAFLERFTKDGQPDPAFGDKGIARPAGIGGAAIFLQQDGGIVVVPTGSGGINLVRFWL